LSAARQMTEWIALKPPPKVGDVIRFRDEVRGRARRGGRRSVGWRTLEAEGIAISGTGTRDDDLTLKVLAEEGAEGRSSWSAAGSCAAASTCIARIARRWRRSDNPLRPRGLRLPQKKPMVGAWLRAP